MKIWLLITKLYQHQNQGMEFNFQKAERIQHLETPYDTGLILIHIPNKFELY